MYEWSINGRKIEIRYINFYFKKTRLIRMDIIQGNRGGDTGSIGILLDNGKVKGRKGGFLTGIAVTVNKNSRLATTIRRVTFDKSDAIAAHDRLEFFDVWYEAENLNLLNIPNNINLPLEIKK